MWIFSFPHYFVSLSEYSQVVFVFTYGSDERDGNESLLCFFLFVFPLETLHENPSVRKCL